MPAQPSRGAATEQARVIASVVTVIGTQDAEVAPVENFAGGDVAGRIDGTAEGTNVVVRDLDLERFLHRRPFENPDFVECGDQTPEVGGVQRELVIAKCPALFHVGEIKLENLGRLSTTRTAWPRASSAAAR